MKARCEPPSSGEVWWRCAKSGRRPGLEVELVYLSGLYSFRRWLGQGYHFAAFMARPVGGSLSPQESEALELRYFAPEDLPQPLGRVRKR